MRHWREGVVLAAVVCLDQLGWLPRITVDAWPTGGTGSYATIVQGTCLLVCLTLVWALVDFLASNRQEKEGHNARRSG